MMHCIFIHGRQKSTFSKYSFGREGEVTKKSTLCTLLIMLTIMDDNFVMYVNVYNVPTSVIFLMHNFEENTSICDHEKRHCLCYENGKMYRPKSVWEMLYCTCLGICKINDS